MYKPFFTLLFTLVSLCCFSQHTEYKRISSALKKFRTTGTKGDSSLLKRALATDPILPLARHSRADIELTMIISGRSTPSMALSIQVYKDTVVARKVSFNLVTKDTDLSNGYTNFKFADATNEKYTSFSNSGAYRLAYKTTDFKLPDGFSSWADLFERLAETNLFTSFDSDGLDSLVKKRYPNMHISRYDLVEIDVKNKSRNRSVQFHERVYSIATDEPGSLPDAPYLADLPEFNLYNKLIRIINQLRTINQ